MHCFSRTSSWVSTDQALAEAHEVFVIAQPALVAGEWRYADARLVEVDARRRHPLADFDGDRDADLLAWAPSVNFTLSNSPAICDFTCTVAEASTTPMA